MPPKKFDVDVEGVGRFVFRWRDMGTQIAIERAISQHTGGQAVPSPSLYWFASTAALFEVLLIEAPEGWAFDALDPTDRQTGNMLQAITEAHSKTEKTFRDRLRPPAAPAGESGGAVDAVRVPPALQPRTD